MPFHGVALSLDRCRDAELGGTKCFLKWILNLGKNDLRVYKGEH